MREELAVRISLTESRVQVDTPVNTDTSRTRLALGLVSKSPCQMEEAQENDQCLPTALPTGTFAIAHALRLSDQCCQRCTPVCITHRLSSSSQMAEQRGQLRPVLLLVAEFLAGKNESHGRPNTVYRLDGPVVRSAVLHVEHDD